jgi:hypothetical protein
MNNKVETDTSYKNDIKIHQNIFLCINCEGVVVAVVVW